MRIKEPSEASEDPLNMTPLIDMVFLLLIFFLVATTFASEERDIAIQLPTTSAPRPLSAPPRQLIINIKEDGSVFVSSRQVDDQALSRLLADTLRDNPDKEVLIRTDERSIFKHYARVVSLCRQAGVKESKLGYLEDELQPVKAAP